MFIIDENFISDFDIKIIQNRVREENFWTLCDSTASKDYSNRFHFENNESVDQFQMVHTFYENAMPKSNFYNDAMRIFGKFMIKHSITPRAVLRGKANMSSKNHMPDQYMPPHVDFLYEHFVFLYYIEDSDGDTIIYNEKYDLNNPEKEVRLTINKKVSPKAGKAMVFDGLTLHSPGFPYLNEKRMVINIPFV